MPSANGFIKTVNDGAEWVASFHYDNILYNLSGTMTPHITFACSDATLTWKDAPPHGKHHYTATLGPTQLRVLTDIHVGIEGTLDTPIEQAVSVSGTFTT